MPLKRMLSSVLTVCGYVLFLLIPAGVRGLEVLSDPDDFGVEYAAYIGYSFTAGLFSVTAALLLLWFQPVVVGDEYSHIVLLIPAPIWIASWVLYLSAVRTYG